MKTKLNDLFDSTDSIEEVLSILDLDDKKSPDFATRNKLKQYLNRVIEVAWKQGYDAGRDDAGESW